MQVLNVFNGYLDADEKRMQARLAEKNASKSGLAALKGASDDIAEAGISSSLMQSYLQVILDFVLSPDARARSMAFAIIQRILNQGLVHPLQVLPKISAFFIALVHAVRNCAGD